MKTQIRWMHRFDLEEVLAIDQYNFNNPWSKEEWIVAMQHRQTVPMVCVEADDDANEDNGYPQSWGESQEDILGFMIYELRKGALHLVKMGVHPDNHLQGVGRKLIDKLIKKVIQHPRRNQITLEVNESNLSGQLFFKHMGFEAISITKGGPEDMYLMRLLCKQRVNVKAKMKGK